MYVVIQKVILMQVFLKIFSFLFFFGTELSFMLSCFTMAISLICVYFIEHILCRTQPQPVLRVEHKHGV